MEGQGAEAAAAEAAAVVDYGELDLLDGGNAAHGLVHGVVLLGVGKLGYTVELLRLKGHGRGIYDEIPAVMLLNQRPAAHGVVLGVFDARRVGVKARAVADLGKGGQSNALKGAFFRVGAQVGGAPYIGHLRHGELLFEPAGDLDLGVFAHAVDQHIRARIDEYRAAHFIVPVIVVREAAQGRFKTADDDRNVRAEGLPCAV